MKDKHMHKQPQQPMPGKWDICADLTLLMQQYQGADRSHKQNAHAIYSRLTKALNSENSQDNLYRLSPEKKALASRALKALEARNFNNATSLIAELSALL